MSNITIQEISKHITDFENRNNISVCINIFSDGSFSINEFWDDEQLEKFTEIEELIKYLDAINLKKGECGRSLSPIQVEDNKPQEEELPCPCCQGGGCPFCSGWGVVKQDKK
jgi:hypothetical protein